GDRGLARLRCRPLRDERCSHADAEFVLALALAVQRLIQVLAGRVVLGKELPLARDAQAIVVALAALPGVAHFQALKRSPRLAAESNVDAYLFDPHGFYPLKVNTRLRRRT